MNGSDSKCILQCIPWIFFKLFVSELQFAVLFINTHDHYIDVCTDLSVFTWVIETLQPAQVADMNHTTNTRSQFYEYTIISDILYQAGMTATFCKLHFNI